MIKSKFSGDTIFWGVFTSIWLIPGGIMIFKGLNNYSLKLNETLILLLFLFLYYILITFLKHIKVIKIEDGKLKYYSILRPFGRTLNLEDYSGKIILKETGTRGSYKTIYLVNNQNKTSFKIMGIHYKKFDELNNAIPLKIMKYPTGIMNYLKILFLEKVSVDTKK